VNLEKMNTDLNISVPSYSYTVLGSKIEKIWLTFFIQRFKRFFFILSTFYEQASVTLANTLKFSNYIKGLSSISSLPT